MSPSNPKANFGSNWRAMPLKSARWAIWLPNRRSSCSSVAPRTSRFSTSSALLLQGMPGLLDQLAGAGRTPAGAREARSARAISAASSIT